MHPIDLQVIVFVRQCVRLRVFDNGVTGVRTDVRTHRSNDAMWLEAASGLDAARSQMTEHARQNPGPYFIFCQNRRAVLASIDTSMSEAARA
jgi:hypothetical protein